MCSALVPKPSEELKESHLTIGALAQACGVTVRTLRYYEEKQLIAPAHRTEGKYRLYAPVSQRRVSAIVALQDLNYSLEQIRDVLGPPSGQVLSKGERIQSTFHSLETQSQLIEDKLDLLQKLKSDLDARLNVLHSVCTPCLDGVLELTSGSVDCDTGCEHREIHFN